MDVIEAAGLALAAGLAGVINAVAGGGSLVSFPAAVAVGLPAVVANATNAVALMPGGVASALGYRRELSRDRAALRVMLPPAFAGGLVGSILLLITPAKVFDTIVPALVFFATALMLYQNLKRKDAPEEGAWALPKRTGVAIALQFLVGVYGGYFGAGMGIMMLAILDRIGGVDIHGMNGVKSVLGASINAIAAATFIVAGAVDYRAAVIMAVGAVGGGFAGASIARRVKPKVVRWAVVAMGLVLTAALAWRRVRAG